MKSLHELGEKVTPFYTLILILVLVSIFFALGRLSALEEKKNPIKIVYPSQEVKQLQTSSVINAISQTTSLSNVSANNTIISDGEVIGSKSGKKYYFPWCGTVKRIKPENQVHFASIEKARSAGFLPSKNCKGLQ